MSPFSLDKLFEQFILEKQYLSNVSPKTVRSYRQAFNSYKRVLSGLSVSDNACTEPGLCPPTKHTLTEFVIGLRKTMSASGANVYIRSMNSFLTWLHENEHIKEPLRIKLLKAERKVFKPLTDQQLRAIFSYKPISFAERRLHTLVLTLLDSGIRIEESLTMKRNQIDFENLVLRVKGKGGKERIVPVSAEGRKQLYKFLKTHSYQLVFSTRHGGRLEYHNVLRDFNQLMAKLGIETDGAFHCLRRTFAKNYVKRGGNVFYLQVILGHSDVSTTRKYVDVTIEDLQEVHSSVSVLENIH